MSKRSAEDDTPEGGESGEGGGDDAKRLKESTEEEANDESSSSSAAATEEQEEQKEQEDSGDGLTSAAIAPPPGMGPTPTPMERGAWLPMLQIFGGSPESECECKAGDGRTWEYVDNTGAVQSSYGSEQMIAWRDAGFFPHQETTVMRLNNGPHCMDAAPPPPPLASPKSSSAMVAAGGAAGSLAAGGGQLGGGSIGAGGFARLDPALKLFVGGLEPTVNDAMFRDYFAQFGGVADAKVMVFRETGYGRGFGFVTFVDKESLDKCVNHPDGHSLAGKWVDLKPADPPVPREQHQATSRPRRCAASGSGSGSAGASGAGRSGYGGPGSSLMKPNPALKLFIGGLHPDCDEASLREYWEQFGVVAAVIVMMDRQTGRSRGFGFVTMGDQASFDKVIAHGGSHEIYGKWSEVKPAEAPGSRQMGGGPHPPQQPPQQQQWGAPQGGPGVGPAAAAPPQHHQWGGPRGAASSRTPRRRSTTTSSSGGRRRCSGGSPAAAAAVGGTGGGGVLSSSSRTRRRGGTRPGSVSWRHRRQRGRRRSAVLEQFGPVADSIVMMDRRRGAAAASAS